MVQMNVDLLSMSSRCSRGSRSLDALDALEDLHASRGITRPTRLDAWHYRVVTCVHVPLAGVVVNGVYHRTTFITG